MSQEIIHGQLARISDKLDKKKHVQKLIETLLEPLPRNYELLSSSQTWCVYWITHSLALLDKPTISDDVTNNVIEFINECAHEDGGYGGGPGQIAHLATTFAAVNALITTSNEKALESIDRAGIVKFLHRMKQDDGSFTMHEDGEIDSRATYCALSVLKCLNIHDPILMDKTADWIISCQTYEGGFGSSPGAEAHGGYSFCCVASLCLLNQLPRVDLSSLLRWLVNKQSQVEGGFCGRSNKLVDSCYSYWQGAIFLLIHPLLEFERKKTCTSSRDDRRNTRSKSKLHESSTSDIFNSWLFDCKRVQDYILNQCQAVDGLLQDKPGMNPDIYHTCYALSGLSLTQHQPDGSVFDMGAHPINIVSITNPLFNITIENLKHCMKYFENKKIDIERAEESSKSGS